MNKVDHESKPHAVRQISQDAGEQQRARAENSIIIAFRAKKINQHRGCCGSGEHYKEPASERAAFLQLSKGNAGILSVREIEDASDYGHITKSKTSHHPGLARLIHQIDAQRDDEITDAPCEPIVFDRFHQCSSLCPKKSPAMPADVRKAFGLPVNLFSGFWATPNFSGRSPEFI